MVLPHSTTAGRVLIATCLITVVLRTQSQLTEEDRQQFLAEHNAYRAEVGSRPLQWDPNLEAIAQEWADELASRPCEWGVSFKVHRNDEDDDDCKDTETCWYDRHALSGNFDLQSKWIGENIRVVASSNPSSALGKTAISVTNAWTDEKVDWNFGPQGTSSCAQDGTVGHYTAAVWADTTHVGCGKAFCTDTSGGDTDGYMVGGWICNYYPGGNFRGKYPYCFANNPSEVGVCEGFEYDASLEPSYCETPSRSCDETGETQCSDSTDPEETDSGVWDGCDESTWPDKDHDLVCSDCKVLVDNFDTSYGTCTAYCAAVGRACVGGWEETSDTCEVKSTLGCGGAIASSDAICECQGDAPPTTTTTVTVAASPEPQPCSLPLSWPEIDALEAAGSRVFTGGLGSLLDVDHHTWLCLELACTTEPNDLACFKYSEGRRAFEWFGFNSELAIVTASELGI